jgi:hypothetical protein
MLTCEEMVREDRKLFINLMPMANSLEVLSGSGGVRPLDRATRPSIACVCGPDFEHFDSEESGKHWARRQDAGVEATVSNETVRGGVLPAVIPWECRIARSDKYTLTIRKVATCTVLVRTYAEEDPTEPELASGLMDKVSFLQKVRRICLGGGL